MSNWIVSEEGYRGLFLFSAYLFRHLLKNIKSNSFNQNSLQKGIANIIDDVLTNFLNNVSIFVFTYIIKDRGIIEVKKKGVKNN
jgi:hypothetical protein